MQPNLITVCRTAVDMENFVAAFYHLKAAALFSHARQNPTGKSHFLLFLLSPGLHLAQIFHGVGSDWVERIVLCIL